MPIDGKEVYIDELEVAILRQFFDHLYLTSSEISDILRRLADKIDTRVHE